jgi:hypothetical protein
VVLHLHTLKENILPGQRDSPVQDQFFRTCHPLYLILHTNYQLWGNLSYYLSPPASLPPPFSLYFSLRPNSLITPSAALPPPFHLPSHPLLPPHPGHLPSPAAEDGGRCHSGRVAPSVRAWRGGAPWSSCGRERSRPAGLSSAVARGRDDARGSAWQVGSCPRHASTPCPAAELHRHIVAPFIRRHRISGMLLCLCPHPILPLLSTSRRGGHPRSRGRGRRWLDGDGEVVLELLPRKSSSSVGFLLCSAQFMVVAGHGGSGALDTASTRRLVVDTGHGGPNGSSLGLPHPHPWARPSGLEEGSSGHGT